MLWGAKRSVRRWALALLIAATALPFAVLIFGGGVIYPEAPESPPRAAVGVPRPFSPDGVWNHPLADDAAVDPASKRLVAGLAAEAATEQRERTGPFIQTRAYGVAVYRVPRDQPNVRVQLDPQAAYADGLRAALRAVPVPDNARPAAGTDGHLVVWQASTDRMWEFWRARRAADGWHAAWGGAMQDVSRNPGYFSSAAWPGAPNTWGASASGLPVLAGLITPSELAAGHIDHALAIALPAPRAGVVAFPAQRTDGTDPSPDAIPEGARLRLDPGLDLDRLGLPAPALVIARAAQRYGLLVRDRTLHAIAFYAEDPTPAGQDPYPLLFDGLSPTDLLADFPWDRLRVMRMQLRAA